MEELTLALKASDASLAETSRELEALREAEAIGKQEPNPNPNPNPNLTRLQLRDVVQKTANTTGKLYLALDTQTEVLIEGDHAAGEEVADAADGADAAMASAPPTPLGLLVQGIGRQGGIRRVHVALRNVWSIELRWRCAGSGPFG